MKYGRTFIESYVVITVIPGTLVSEATRDTAAHRLELRIGHPAGVIETESDVVLAEPGRNHGVRRATLGRTARRILDGTVYLDLDNAA